MALWRPHLLSQFSLRLFFQTLQRLRVTFYFTAPLVAAITDPIQAVRQPMHHQNLQHVRYLKAHSEAREDLAQTHLSIYLV